MSQISTDTVRSYARLGANHGYVIDGDVAQLHADVEFIETPPLTGNWALQLWACDQPHTGGPLVGFKVAEAALNGSPDAGDHARRLDAATHARVPGGLRDYAMVLVLASGDAGHETQVLDFANYPARQQFVTPHLDGRVGYRIDGDDLVLEADAIRSPRASDNISGSLSLELWALPEPYRGGTVNGHALGRVDLGRLAGQTAIETVAERSPLSPPPAGNWEIVLMLREWAGPSGYVTRDFARFAVPYVVSAPAQAKEPARVEEPAQAKEPAQVIEPTPAKAPVIAKAAPQPPARRSVNRATVEELAAIKGLTRKVAAAIVKKRPYKSLDSLIDVHGIGPKLLARLRTDLTLD